MKIKAPRGTQDIMSPSSKLWQLIEAEAIKIFSAAGFEEIRTPIFEATELFDRAVGSSSDIVNKEMYTFDDRSERSLTLRPEATACIIRAYLENALDRQGKPSKLWYRGPMFRYERPQTGRYRQFHQIGIEAIGSAAPYMDLEVINLGLKLLQNLEIQGLTLHINSLGNRASHQAYSQALKQFLEGLQDQVCEDCQRRFKTNPLRALDCKVPEDQEFYRDAPKITDYLDSESEEIWQACKSGLDNLGISYVEDPKLVRGLDYYTHCVFEIKSDASELGVQNTILAGGRYDNLVETLGGPSTPAVGWALGIERLAQLIQDHQINDSSAYIISDDIAAAQELAIKLRADTDLRVEYSYDVSKFNKQLDKAVKKGFTWVIFYLEEERNSQKFKIKNLSEAKEYSDLDYNDVTEHINQGSSLQTLGS